MKLTDPAAAAKLAALIAPALKRAAQRRTAGASETTPTVLEDRNDSATHLRTAA